MPLPSLPPVCPRAGCGKPGFFTERRPLFEVQTSTGMLLNTDAGNPMTPVYEDVRPVQTRPLPLHPLAGVEDTKDSAALAGECLHPPGLEQPPSPHPTRLPRWQRKSSPKPSPLPVGSVGAAGVSTHVAGPEGPLPARVFQGGFYTDLHRFLGVASGSQVLYVGDHVYGDIVRRQEKASGARPCLLPRLLLWTRWGGCI